MYNWFSILLIICGGLISYFLYMIISCKVKLHYFHVKMNNDDEIKKDIKLLEGRF